MKLQQKYVNLKDKYFKYIILIESGVFIVTFDNDAYILNYLFNYQLRNTNDIIKVGFPKKSINEVLKILNENEINVVYNEQKYEYKNNKYDNLLYLAKKKYYQNLNEKVLLEEIMFLIKNNSDNLMKIRNFIDEL